MPKTSSWERQDIMPNLNSPTMFVLANSSGSFSLPLFLAFFLFFLSFSSSLPSLPLSHSLPFLLCYSHYYRKRKFVEKKKPDEGKDLLFIELVEGRKIPKKDLVGQSDPFCILRLVNDDSQEQYSEVFIIIIYNNNVEHIH